MDPSRLAQRVRSGTSSSESIEPPARVGRIRDLNDRLRQTFMSGRVMITAGVQILDDERRADLFTQVRTFDSFTLDNDPYGEHDFGRVAVGDQGFFWKIECYDSDLQHLSLDAADENVTVRVMTIMREDEY